MSEDGTPNSSFTYRLLVPLTADGRWLQFSQVQPRLFRAMMGALGLAWMFDDPHWEGIPEFAEPEKRLEFWETLLQAARERTVDEWQRVFEADHDVWAEVFRRGTELLHHPQMVHNRMVTEFTDNRGVAMRQPGALVRILDGPDLDGDLTAPDRDQHGEQIRRSVSTPGASTEGSRAR